MPSVKTIVWIAGIAVVVLIAANKVEPIKKFIYG